MFDLVKINDISKNIISKIPAKKLLRNIVDWANEYDETLAKVLLANQERAENILKIDRENDRPRKDIAHYSEFKNIFSYMFNEYYDPNTSLSYDEKLNIKDVVNLLEKYICVYSSTDEKQDWFEKIKIVAAECGFVDMKTYKANPEAYIGNIADASNIIRVAVTGKTTTPDLYEIMKLLGDHEISSRISFAIKRLK